MIASITSPRRAWSVLATGVLALGGIPAGTAPAQGRLILAGATLIDGTGAAPLPDARIVIEDGRFTCVSGPGGCDPRPGDQVLRLAGRWVTPGLIDTHIHLLYGDADDAVLARAQRLRFALGITTTRDAGSPAVTRLLALRDTAADANLPVPRLSVAARVSIENAERFGVPVGESLARHLIALGVDAIKLKPPFGDDIWLGEIRAAREADVPVFGHTWAEPPRGPFAREAAAAGLSGVSHLLGLVMEMQPPGTDLTIPAGTEAEAWAWLRSLWTTIDTAAMDRLIGDLVRAGVWIEPTLAHEYHWGRSLPRHEHLRFLDPPARLSDVLPLRRASTASREPRYPDTFDRQQAFVRTFAERGGMLVTGSDGVDAGLDLHEEIRLIAEATGDPMTGLLAATRNAALAIGREDLGTIVPGSVADLVVHEVDPLATPGATTHVVYVIKGGVLHAGGDLVSEFRSSYAEAVRETWFRALRRWLPPLALLVAVGIVGVILLRRRRAAS